MTQCRQVSRTFVADLRQALRSAVALLLPFRTHGCVRYEGLRLSPPASQGFDHRSWQPGRWALTEEYHTVNYRKKTIIKPNRTTVDIASFLEKKNAMTTCKITAKKTSRPRNTSRLPEFSADIAGLY
ncbi:hypothetical protein PSTH1771_03880 [Pseudomonas syringae pv. theae]|nr:hypothetical protein PSTH68_02155 [Pseudomonas syringae pv. theae]GKQ44966.1 hypothetical protein PSTH2693_07440 [Pseudomonas syringae pv. theae]GKS04114.1 hypothetical protein PSTH1771_03880 [Pseudomonas syringae pv. theae]